MNSGIYQLKNTANGKLYVGQTKNFSNRKKSHLKSLKNGTHYNRYLQRSYNKYGQGFFVFEIIERCEVELLNARERYWIRELQTEYNDKGYNSAYAVEVFKNYDLKRKINRNKRTLPKVLSTKEVRRKSKLGIQRYWSLANDDVRLRYSLNKSTIDLVSIHQLKSALAYDINLSCKEIAQRLSLPETIVIHTAHLQSFRMVCKELNNLIINRTKRLEVRTNRIMIRLWCEGYSTNDIASFMRINKRTVIRKLKTIRTADIDRCRLKVINRAEQKRFSQVQTMKGMGFNMVDVHRKLGYSRDYIRSIWNSEQPNEYKSSKETRGINRIFTIENLK
ncbi:GIY-YIG nuclease family protein [Enterococcus casseliflavus]|uniref:GIY-YIG nuclease family protein n=1 Tax=Enterococcus casseliflavus TaxID=37734 RepID=UPI00188350BE|nr:GIY-YIG nuclease family protein [Enterococcus casseliflavus]MBE9899637.1 GIY-YIG nuclease family protein [Enterococcus casseliflavus]MBE9902923.1 GIY-YIG nuclease family protein [Enterococcus casseliflavus]MBE9923050.1 GIY-YIG nuclease family protein [Enterococcus casseliflavus]